MTIDEAAPAMVPVQQSRGCPPHVLAQWGTSALFVCGDCGQIFLRVEADDESSDAATGDA